MKGVWFITSGLDTGISKTVGKALQFVSKSCIGIVPWGTVSNNNQFVAKDKSTLGQTITYKSKKGNKREICLDHNHTHFIMVDDGTTKANAEIPFRLNFEAYLSMGMKGIPLGKFC